MRLEDDDNVQRPLISVLIVTYNSAQLLDASAGRLVGHTDIQIVVVDNASTDGTVARLRSSFPTIQVVENETNLGFGAAMNIAARQASGETLVLLNPDAEIDPEVLRSLAVRTRDIGGIAAPLIRQPDGRLKIHSAGRFPSAWRMFLHYSGVSRLARNQHWLEGHYLIPHGHESSTISTDWVTGAILAIRREDWDSVGGLSERWFMYAEDIELCWRIRKASLPVLLHTDLEAHHAVGSSDSTQSFSANPAWIVNLYDFYMWKMNNNKITSIFWRGVVMLGLFSRSIVYRIRASSAPEHAKSMWLLEARKFRNYAVAVVRLNERTRTGGNH